MSVRANIPDLDHECKYLIGSGPNAEGLEPSEVVEKITDEHAGEYGIELRYFERGEGDWFWYVMQEGDVFACFNPENGAADTYTDPSDLEVAIENAEDVWLVPRKRLPKWGDWSAYYSCTVCSGALRDDDKTLTRKGYAHEVCAA